MKDADPPQDEEKVTQEDLDMVDKVTNKLSTVIDRMGQQTKDEGVLKQYFRAFIKKTLENFSSAKMIMFFFPLFTSAWFLHTLLGMIKDATKITDPAVALIVANFFQIGMNGFISWCTFTVSLGGAVLAVREVFKVQKLKALNDGTKATNDDIKNMSD